MATQRCFDLPQLDAKAADLDLMVSATQELDVAIREIPGNVARLIKRAAGSGLKGFGMNFSAVSSGWLR